MANESKKDVQNDLSRNSLIAVNNGPSLARAEGPAAPPTPATPFRPPPLGPRVLPPPSTPPLPLTPSPSASRGRGASLSSSNPFGTGNLPSGKDPWRHPHAAHSKPRDLTAALRFWERVAPRTEPISTAASVMWATRAVTRDVTVHDGCQLS